MTAASDPMGQAAHQAAVSSTRLDFYLHGASSSKLSRDQRAENLRRAFRIWLPLVRRMSELEKAAPNAFREAMREDAAVASFPTVEGL